MSSYAAPAVAGFEFHIDQRAMGKIGRAMLRGREPVLANTYYGCACGYAEGDGLLRQGRANSQFTGLRVIAEHLSLALALG